MGKMGGRMRIQQIEIENFRLLRSVSVAMESTSTVIVGRNNSGKTSLAEAVSRFTSSSNPKFEIEDFSTFTYEEFRTSYEFFISGDSEKARAALPSIQMKLLVDYKNSDGDFGPLAPFVIDLDQECHTALIIARYELAPGRLKEFFSSVTAGESGTATTTDVIASVRQNLSAMYYRTITAVDPTDNSNVRDVGIDSLRALITVDFLKAQRGLDDDKAHPKDLIGKILETLFIAAAKSPEGTLNKTTADELVGAVAGIENDLDTRLRGMLLKLLPALSTFGYPSLGNQQLSTRTTLDVEKLLSNFTKVEYEGASGVSFPEAYSGLGSRNLVFILFTVLDYYRKYAIRGATPGVHLVFLEEPEAHLHPQMQEVFIGKLAALKRLFPEQDTSNNVWPVQFIITTHSSHVANQAEFSAIRYFKADDGTSLNEPRSTDVKDLSKAHENFPDLDVDFLHQYLTLTRSDLFFADKAILVEGTSERLIIPKIIAQMEKAGASPGLASQYVTQLEVGGAYAHLFFPLLDFLGLPALIVTDLDPVAMIKGPQREAVITHASDRTSNACIKSWFNDSTVEPLALIKLVGTGRLRSAERYLAYQVPEEGQKACGRTFEDSFVLANPSLFDLILTNDPLEDEQKARQIAAGFKKSDFALEYAIRKTIWNPQRYLALGLEWLLHYPKLNPPAAAGSADETATVVVK